LNGGVVYGNNLSDPTALRISSLDIPVIKVGAGNAPLAVDAPPLEALNPAPVPNDVNPNLEQGFAFNLYNNLWSTNAIQWYPFAPQGDEDWVFRFSISAP